MRPAWLPVIAVAVGVGACADSAPVALDACGKRVTIESPARLTYVGADDVVDDVAILCRRLAAASLRAKLLGGGRDRIVIEVRAKDVPAVRAIARTGQLAFYDWEANVVGPSGRPAPEDASVTGGVGAGREGALSFFEAIARAAKRPANVEENNGRRGSRYYAVDAAAGKVYGSGAPTREGALEAVPAAERDGAEVREVPPGTIVLRGEGVAPAAGDPDAGGYFVLRDDVALRGADVRDPEQNFANPDGSGEPIVTFEFTSAGGKAFEGLTRTLAERGSGRVGEVPPDDANQHFAIVVDDQIVSVPFVDFRQNRRGIDPTSGSQVQGGFTVASARQLATVLKSGALPVALELVAMTKP